MPVIAILSVVAQIICVYHAIKSGRDRYWLYIIIIFPGIGCLIYFLTEIFPELQGDIQTRNKKRRKMKTSYLKDQLELSPSLKNKKNLAEAYIDRGQFDRAITLYQSCLDGLNKNDSSIIEGLTCAYFFKGDMEKAKIYLLRLREIRHNGTVKRETCDEFDLLLARVYEEQGDIEKAIEEYSSMVRKFSGEEARCRYALLLKKCGKPEEAENYFREIIRNARLSPKYYTRIQKKWIKIAKSEV